MMETIVKLIPITVVVLAFLALILLAPEVLGPNGRRGWEKRTSNWSFGLERWAKSWQMGRDRWWMKVKPFRRPAILVLVVAVYLSVIFYAVWRVTSPKIDLPMIVITVLLVLACTGLLIGVAFYQSRKAPRRKFRSEFLHWLWVGLRALLFAAFFVVGFVVVSLMIFLARSILPRIFDRAAKNMGKWARNDSSRLWMTRWGWFFTLLILFGESYLVVTNLVAK